MRKIPFAVFTLITFIFSAFVVASCDTDTSSSYEPGVVTRVVLSLDNLFIEPGDSPTLTATVLPDNAPDKQVKWRSSNPGAATVDEDGTVTGIADGTTTITVTAMDDNIMAQCDVTVGTIPVKAESVSLNKNTLDIAAEKSETLTYTVYPDDATYTDKVKWTSSNPDIAAVYQDGTVTAKSGGSATITVSTENGGKTDTCELTVIFPVPVSGVSLDHTKIMVKSNNSTEQLSAMVLPADATNKQITWASSNTDVATVSANGLVTGKAVGNATITVTTVEGGKTATCAVTVYGYFGVDNPQAWAGALSGISGADDGSSAGSPAVFIINITGNVSVAGIVEGGSSISGNYKEVRLTGGSGTLSLSSPGSLITAFANQTFIIDGPTLQGTSSNNTSLVTTDGKLELRSGCITGNNILDDFISGGGVCVTGGNFTMTGGKINNNSAGANGGGGGVAITFGSFEMSGGEISGNSTNGGTGGGVYVTQGSFKMTGGEISGNSAINNGGNGGGVFVSDGSFEMTSGEISGNSAGNYGGGLGVVNSNFSMTGGTIYGNDEDSLSNTATNSGAAVYIASSTSIDYTIHTYPP